MPSNPATPNAESETAAMPSSAQERIVEFDGVGRIRRLSRSANQIDIARLVDLEVATPLHALHDLPEEQRVQLVLKTAADTYRWLLHLRQKASVMADEVIQEARQHAMMQTGLTPVEIDTILKHRGTQNYKRFLGAMLIYLDRKHRNMSR